MATQQQQQQQQQKKGEYVRLGVDTLMSNVISKSEMPFIAIDELSLITLEYRPYNDANALAVTAAAKDDGLSLSNNKKTVFIQREQKTFSKQEPDQLLESIEKAQVRLSGKSLQIIKEHLEQASNSLHNAIKDAIKTLHINEQSYSTPTKANNIAKIIENFLGKMYGYIPMQSFPLCDKDIAEQKNKFTSILHNPNMQCESSLLFTELVSFVHPQNGMKQKDEFLIILSQGQHYKKPAYSPTEWYKLAICIQRINQDTKQPTNKKNIITMSTLETEQLIKMLNNNKSNLAKFFPVTLGFINNNQQSSLKLMLDKTVSSNWTTNPYMEAFQFQEMQSRQSTVQ